MRIICLEEHVMDGPLTEAARQVAAFEAPYTADLLGGRYQDDPSHEANDRPRLAPLGRIVEAAREPLEMRLDAMDRAGIDCQVVSLTNQPQLVDKSEARRLVTDANDRLATAVARHPYRFSAFFTLPWQDPEAAVLEIERCVRELGLPATMLSGRPEGSLFLDDPRFDPILAKLAELDVPLYLHPGAPLRAVQKLYYDGFAPELTARLSLIGWGWHNEAGIQVVRLIVSGVLERHRNLKIVSGHWGEMVPFFLQRMDDTMPPGLTGLSRTISETYRAQVWVGPSGMLNTPHFMFVREVLGIDRIVFSIDYPYLTLTGARSWLESLPIPLAEKEAVAFRNAEFLLRRLPGSGTTPPT